jgi:cytosine/adenosine deaminase-related metal-dependent hydrolase
LGGHLDEAMMLKGARVARTATAASRDALCIRRGRVFFGEAPHARCTLDLTGFLILPGLINSHDHLELNLFPRLGRGPYRNATAWAEDVYHPDRPPIKQHLRVPKPLRLFWGGIKNLVSGVTSVAHHNPFYADVFNQEFPVRVIKNYGWAHSMHFAPDWLSRFRTTSRRHPFIIHLAEGTDEESRRELYELEAASALAASTVLVHGVALTSDDLQILRKRKASLVWCPTSNFFTLGRSLSPGILSSGAPISLGSDSALTAEGDLIDELRAARRQVDPVRLYRMVTHAAARILRLDSGEGCIRNGGAADLLIVRDRGQTPAEALADLQPEAVIVNGRLNLVSESLANRFPAKEVGHFESLAVEGRGRWRVPFKISNLISQTAEALNGKLHLAGKLVYS